MCFVVFWGFKPLGFDDMLRCGVVYLEAIGCLLNCHLILIDEVNQFTALGRLDGIVASLGFGERRNGVIKMFRLLSCRSCLRLTFAAGGN